MRFLCLFFILTFATYCYPQEYQTDTLRIYYPIDITSLHPTAKKSLDSLASMVQRNKKAFVSITGFADYLGTNPHNIDLSVNRARNIKDYLVLQGLDSIQIKICEGKGALQPGGLLNKQKGVPEHRRAELVITWPILKKPPAKKPPVKNSHLAGKLDEIPKTINIDKLKKGDQLVLKNLNFVGGRHMLIPQSYPIIQELTNIMKQNPGLKIEIQGHICCDTSSIDGYDYDTKTDDLSVQRAKVVYDHLIHMGIDSSRVSYKGFGGKIRLVKVERTEEDRQRNRRVEIKIVEK